MVDASSTTTTAWLTGSTHPRVKQPSTCAWAWNTDWPALGPTLNTSRELAAALVVRDALRDVERSQLPR